MEHCFPLCAAHNKATAALTSRQLGQHPLTLIFLSQGFMYNLENNPYNNKKKLDKVLLEQVNHLEKD